MLCGDQNEATAFAGRAFDALGRADLLGAIQPEEIYRTCWRVFVECSDDRAEPALAAALAHLDEMAGRIDDEELRNWYLHRIPANVEIARASSP